MYGAFCTIAICAAAISGYGAFSKNAQSDGNNLLMENVEALTEDESTDSYAWSNPIDCPGLWTGDYSVCEKNGPGNSCSSGGDKTCDCGKNC